MIAFFLLSATYGFIITAITLFFMKDLLKTFLHATFQYILNPAVWRSQPTQAPQPIIIQHSPPIESSSSKPDIRDHTLNTALQLLLLQKHHEIKKQNPSLEPSSVQNLPIENVSEGNKSVNSDTSGVSSSNTEETNVTDAESSSQVENIETKKATDPSQKDQKELSVETEISTEDVPESQSSKSSSYSILSSSDFDGNATFDCEEINISNDSEKTE